jgi:5-hydroxyisourate hydrolase
MGLSTHILDTALGRPAANVAIELYELRGLTWHRINAAHTDSDGRCKTILGDNPLHAAEYKLRFATAEYFHSQNLTSLYPFVEIAFTIRNPDEHYHIPLLLTANGYTTYRGT